jgi:hypothetical protein
MAVNGTTQIKTLKNKQILWSIVRLLLGAVLGATVYLVTANIIVDKTYGGCYPGFFRGVIESSKFPAWILIGSIMSPESKFYQPVQYLLASIPYAILGALIALGSKKVAVLIVGLLTVLFPCVSWLLWIFFMGFMCA